ncbi:hypothetical protein [Sorangium sp. So ce145]|uniref:hypothetical protein n=1 Tax=Sorangium sp. So ce145 TaxID=3133285 RepID=UPI0005D2B533
MAKPVYFATGLGAASLGGSGAAAGAAEAAGAAGGGSTLFVAMGAAEAEAAGASAGGGVSPRRKPSRPQRQST